MTAKERARILQALLVWLDERIAGSRNNSPVIYIHYCAAKDYLYYARHGSKPSHTIHRYQQWLMRQPRNVKLYDAIWDKLEALIVSVEAPKP